MIKGIKLQLKCIKYPDYNYFSQGHRYSETINKGKTSWEDQWNQRECDYWDLTSSKQLEQSDSKLAYEIVELSVRTRWRWRLSRSL